MEVQCLSWKQEFQRPVSLIIAKFLEEAQAKEEVEGQRGITLTLTSQFMLSTSGTLCKREKEKRVTQRLRNARGDERHHRLWGDRVIIAAHATSRLIQ